MYEDLKLDSLLFATYGSKMAKFLVKWIVESDEDDFIFNVEKEVNEELLKKMGYIHHYVQDFPYLTKHAPKMDVLGYPELRYNHRNFIKI